MAVGISISFGSKLLDHVFSFIFGVHICCLLACEVEVLCVDDWSCYPFILYFPFQPVLHNWCNKGCGMCYPVCGMVHIKEPLLLIEKGSPCDGSGFPRYLSGPLPYFQHNTTIKYNVLSVSLNKHFLPS